jgi:hypothetical protein
MAKGSFYSASDFVHWDVTWIEAAGSFFWWQLR